MLKAGLIKVKRIANEEIIIAIAMTKTIITVIMKIITIIMKTIRMKNC